MNFKAIQILFLTTLLAGNALGKSTAIIFSYDCNPKSTFGSSSENQIGVLSAMGWNIQYYCGNDQQQVYDHCTNRNDALTNQSVICSLEELELENGDDVLVLFNTHGELEIKTESLEIENGLQLHHEVQDPKRQGLVTFQKDSKMREPKTFPVDHYMRLVNEIETRNPGGTNWMLNNSCYSGSCFQYVSQNASTCSISSAPEDEDAQLNNYLYIAFQNLPGSPSLYFTELDRSTLYITEEVGTQLRKFPSTARIINRKLKKVQKKIEFSSTRMKEILSKSLWYDNSGNAGIFTHGFELDDLNVSGDLEFARRYYNFLHRLSESQQAIAKPILQSFMETYENVQRKIKPTSFMGGLVRDQNPYDRKKSLLRSRLMSIAIAESTSNCANFNLNRKSDSLPF